MKIGFDNEKYLKTQSEHIMERISQFDNKLYLEFRSLGVLSRYKQAQVGWAEMTQDKGPPRLFKHSFIHAKIIY